MIALIVLFFIRLAEGLRDLAIDVIAWVSQVAAGIICGLVTGVVLFVKGITGFFSGKG